MALEAMTEPRPDSEGRPQAGGGGARRRPARPTSGGGRPGVTPSAGQRNRLMTTALGRAQGQQPVSRPQPGPPGFGQMPSLPQPPQMPQVSQMPQMPRPQMQPRPSMPLNPGPAQAGPEMMAPQTGGPEPKPEGMGMQLPAMPGQYGGFNPQAGMGMRRPGGGSVFGNPWGGFGG